MVLHGRRSSGLESRHRSFTFSSITLRAFAALTFVMVLVPSAHADVLFEGYSKVILGDTHVGYAVQRYEFDPKKQEFKTISLLRLSQAAGNLTESLIARSNSSFKPISYNYTSLSGDQSKTIDATFKSGKDGETMTAIVKEGAKSQTISRKLPKGVFLSSFLGYVMLQGKEGIKTGVKYSYQAIAEEDAIVHPGEAFVAEEEAILGVNAFKVLNTYKGAKFKSYVTHKGEVIATEAPVQSLRTELVPNIQIATAGLPVNSTNMQILFGAIPKGLENVVARRAAAPEGKAPTPAEITAKKNQNMNASGDGANAAEATPQPENPKSEGVSGGQGIMIKGTPPASTPSSKAKSNGR